MRKLIPLLLILMLFAGATALSGPGIQAQEEVEITFVHIFPDERDLRRQAIREIADEFEAQNPGVRVNIESTTELYEDVFNNALLAAEQGDAPHIIQLEDTLVQLAIDSQQFVRVQDYASEEQLASLEDMLPSVRSYYNMGEAVWGIPWNVSNPVLYWNPNHFEAAGLDPTQPPRTFQEILDACEAIMAAEIENLTGCINFTVTSWFVEQWVSMQNALYVDQNNGRDGRATEAYLDSEAILKVLNWWKTLKDEGYFVYSGAQQAYQPEGITFISGRTAMHISSSAGLSNILQFGQTMGRFTTGIAPLPMPDEDATNGITPGGGSLWVLQGHSEAETQAAVDFAFFLTNTANDKKWHQSSGYLPVRQSSIDELSAEGWFEENPAYTVALNQLLDRPVNVANSGAQMGAYAQVRQALMDAIQSVIDGGEDPLEALQAAKVIADESLQAYNSFFE